jgi:hypothetical protein
MQAVGGDRKDPKVQYILFKLDLDTVNICISQRIESGTELGTEPGMEPGTEPGMEPNTELGTEPEMEPGTEPYWRSIILRRFQQRKIFSSTAPSSAPAPFFIK